MVVRNVREDEGRALLQSLDALRSASQASSAVTVHVLPAADHDGLCAWKILEVILMREGVNYVVVPVTGNTEIVEHIRNLGEDAEVRWLVMLNCGATLDLQDQLEKCRAPPDLCCLVIDSHRPFLLQNLSERNQRVFVLNDDPIAEANGILPPVDDDDEEEAAESGSEGEENWDPDQPGDGRSRGEVAAERLTRKRRRQADRAQRMETKRRRVNEYYLTSYCAMPTGMSLFKMATQVAPASQDMLWLAAVSLLGYHQLGFISEVEYSRLLFEDLKEAHDRAADASLSSGSLGSTAPDSTQGSEGDPDEQSRRPQPRSLPSKRRLRFEADLRLACYRHTTLEDSISRSGYFYGALQLHRDKGQRALKNFFATAGIKPDDYKQLYSCMQLPIKKGLRKKFREHGKLYGLTESRMFLQQFVRDLGPLGDSSPALLLHELSCSDAVDVTMSLLSAVPGALNASNIEQLPQTADGRRDVAAVSEMEREALVANFWRASDAVLCKEPAPLKEGLAEALESAAAVRDLCRLIRDTKAVHSARQFRWVKIEQPPNIFRHHLNIRRLAVWMLQVLFPARTGVGGPERPLLVMVHDQVRDTYLCVGATPTRLSEQDEFGNLFRSVLRSDPSLKYRYDFFDRSCIEIASDDFERFWELLSS